MDIVFILGGILLGIRILDQWDGQKDFFRKIEQKILPYDTLIGGIMLVIGIFNLIKGNCVITNVIGICAGILLSYSYLVKIQSIKEYVIKISDTISPFKAFLGIGLLITGVLGILDIPLFC